MSTARYIVGDVFTEMAKMPDASVDCLITSPPFLTLRSYLPADHPDKHLEIGSEATPALFLTTLLALTREWRRILTPTGSLCVELGDTYSGSGGAGGDDSNLTKPIRHAAGGHRYDDTFKSVAVRARSGGWPLDKSLCLIPSSYAWALAYGHNPFDPDDRIVPWRVRNLIVWHRPNPPVGALGDKVRPSTSYVTVACTAKDRWFDLDAERTAVDQRPIGTNGPKSKAKVSPSTGFGEDAGYDVRISSNPAGAPPLDCWIDTTDADVWTIPTAPYPGAHYATFPPALPRKLINLMCPMQVCTVCGEPRRRITSEPEYVALRQPFAEGQTWGNDTVGMSGSKAPAARQVETLGWSDCGCVPCPCGPGCKQYCSKRKWRRGIVCDPFAGSGTTLQAASELGRDSIGIDLDPRNLELARQRLGMFLVEDEVPA